ncbi:hypothetical protein D9M73_273930 [compost metagenome]
MQRGKLLGMQLDRQTEALRRLEHLLHLCRRERQVFAEGVHRIHQPFAGQRREDFPADQIDVVVGATGIFRRQRMGRQAGGAHRHRQRLAEATGDAEHLALAGEIEAVAGFHLQYGHAIGQQ